MKTKILIIIFFIIFSCTGCNIVRENSEENINSEKLNTSPPIVNEKTKEVQIDKDKTINLLPEELATDPDGDVLQFSITEGTFIDAEFAEITISGEKIEIKGIEDVNSNITKTIAINITDGEFRTEMDLIVSGVDKEANLSNNSSIPYAKGNPVKFTTSIEDLYIDVNDLAGSSGELVIKSINGDSTFEGTYGQAVLYNNTKIKYTPTSSGVETFNVVISNGTNNIAVNVKITIN